MYASFPFSMENIPRQKSFACLSLKFGSIVSALLIILYSVLLLAQCIAALGQLTTPTANDEEPMVLLVMVITVTITYTITLFLTALMLVGVLREKLQLIRPWVMWTSVQIIVYVMMFIYWTTVSFTSHAGGNSLVMYAFAFLTLLIRFYMLMLVASYYKQLEEEQFEGERVKTLVHQDTWYNSA